MNHIAPIHESAIRSIALDRLFIAPENVRKTPPDAIAEAEMKASIATYGLLKNLVARSEGPDGDGIWFEDPALLNKLAMAKLGETVKDLATRWHWATAMPEIDWTLIARYGRIHPEPATPTDDDWTEALGEEAEAIGTRTCEINLAIEARATYRAEDYDIAGAIATIGRNGELQVIQGLVRPEDMSNPADSGDSAGGDAGDGDGDDATGADRFQRAAISAPIASPADPQAEARKEAGVGIGLADDLRSIRTALVKAHLGNDFEAAFDLMLFQLGRAVFTHGYRAHALDIAIRETPDRPTTRMNDRISAPGARARRCSPTAPTCRSIG